MSFPSLRGAPPSAARMFPGADTYDSHARGVSVQSGTVAADAPVQHTNPDEGGRSDLLGHDPIVNAAQLGTDLAPIPGVVTRDVYGGVRQSDFQRTFRDIPMADGTHVELAHRRSIQVLAPQYVLPPEPSAGLPSVRVPPVSDPLARACANAKAAQAGGGS